MKIENIVCSGTFNQELDLRKLSESDDRIEYGKNKYPGAYVKFDNHSITIYRTGKYIMPGMRSIRDIADTFRKLKEILDPFCDVSLFSAPEIRNLVCSSTVGHDLVLDQLQIELLNEEYDAVYEPEAFPGLILKTDLATFNVFSSGKFLILGCTDTTIVQQCEDEFLALIKCIEER